MERHICFGGQRIAYEFERKRVKNINLRIRADGTVHVSANKGVPVELAEEFMRSKADFILKALENCRKRAGTQNVRYFSEDEIRGVILRLCRAAYPYFEKRGVAYPEIKFRKMVSRWGSCQPARGVLTFNINLMYAPIECINYVVLHEFTHFFEANHSKKFYAELLKTCPGWKECRKKLREITL